MVLENPPLLKVEKATMLINPSEENKKYFEQIVGIPQQDWKFELARKNQLKKIEERKKDLQKNFTNKNQHFYYQI